MSDHYLCLLSYELGVRSKSQDYTVIEKRKLTDDSMLKIQEDLLFHDWSLVNDMGINEGYEYLVKVISRVMDQHAPKKVIKMHADQQFREAWLTVQLKKYNAKCRKLCNKARISGTASDHEHYKQYRNILNRLKLNQKCQHYKEVFTKIGKSSKLLWNVINGILKKSHNKSSIVEIKVNDKIICEQNEICDVLNDHFASTGNHLQSTIAQCKDDRNACSFVKTAGNLNKFAFKQVSEGEIHKIVSKMEVKMGSGFDNISNALLKRLIPVIKGPLCTIFNKSLVLGIFPDLMKLAKIIPLHKGGEQNLCDNYRPISLLPVISKVLEKIVYQQTLAFLTDHNIISPFEKVIQQLMLL